MKAIVCTGYGPPEVLQLKQVKAPTPARNEVRIKIFATAVTASESLVRGLKVARRYQLLLRLLIGFKAPRQHLLAVPTVALPALIRMAMVPMCWPVKHPETVSSLATLTTARRL